MIILSWELDLETAGGYLIEQLPVKTPKQRYFEQ
jgi:hypothetical protein